MSRGSFLNRKSFVTTCASALLLILAVACGASGAIAADYWQTPAIEGYGRIHPRPDAAVQPDKAKTYKVAFDITTEARQRSQPNPGLNRVARAVNTFVSAGVPLDQLNFVAIIHGPATPSVLNDKQYRRRFNTANPNLDLIAKLRQAGVKVHVCSQALAENSYQDKWVDPNVTVTLSALSDLAVYGNRGYSYQKL